MNKEDIQKFIEYFGDVLDVSLKEGVWWKANTNQTDIWWSLGNDLEFEYSAEVLSFYPKGDGFVLVRVEDGCGGESVLIFEETFELQEEE